MPIKGRWFQDFAFLDPHNLREISSLTLVESLRIQTVLVGHNIVRVYRLQRKKLKFHFFVSIVIWCDSTVLTSFAKLLFTCFITNEVT